MADPVFFIDGDFVALADELFTEFGVDGILRRRSYIADPGDPRSRTEQLPQDIPIKVIDAGAVEAFTPNRKISNSQSIFFSGANLGVTPDADSDSIIMKKTDGSFSDELKVTRYQPVFRGLEQVILWEAVREG